MCMKRPGARSVSGRKCLPLSSNKPPDKQNVPKKSACFYQVDPYKRWKCQGRHDIQRCLQSASSFAPSILSDPMSRQPTTTSECLVLRSPSTSRSAASDLANLQPALSLPVAGVSGIMQSDRRNTNGMPPESVIEISKHSQSTLEPLSKHSQSSLEPLSKHS